MSYRYSLLLATAAITAWNAQAQIATLTPEQPRWGQILTLTYDLSAEEAAFTEQDEVYAFINWAHAGGAYVEDYVPLALQDRLFTGRITVPPDVHAATIFFMTPQRYDPDVQLTPVFYRDDGVAARGAYRSLAFHNTAKADSLLTEEWRLYPDNWAAYQTRWQTASALRPAELDALVRADMMRIEREAGEETAELLYARAYGHILIGDEPAARAVLTKLAERHPTSAYLAPAVSHYNYQVFRQQIEGAGPEAVKALQRQLVLDHPETAFARENVGMLTSSNDADATSLDAVRAVVEPWMQAQPEHPMPYFYYGLAAHRSGQDLDAGAAHMGRALALLLANELRFHGDFSGFLTEMTLPSAYRYAAEIARQREDWGNAVAYARMAQTTQRQTDPQPFELEAEIWAALGAESQAETAYVAALDHGSQVAEEALRALYERRHGSPAGFEAHLAALTRSAADAAAKPPAAAFTTTTLDGTTLDLEALKGKVVVLNFWFIGCAPCIVEMPGLNALVAEFAEQDVVFIAFALDGEEDLRAFLETKAFDYQIVPAASGVAELYGVSSYPTHIVINKRGEIETTLTGGSAERHDDLRPYITRLLK